ncbi:ferredoxin [Crocinitomix catalasitica]|uniref:ferredoxin n=1 Tax=Crocinitomix catalasitica TaxID=184607 RepID=UPI0004899D34|nr:ferredoxin [Crocinitomix catalasitica]
MTDNSSKKYPSQPENVGDFYVTKDECITCGAPEAEAPDIIEHSKKDEFGQCYFKKQPESETELDQAIKAMMVSCVSALRYGGKDEKIIKRLYENDMSDFCDNPPDKNIEPIIRDKMTFNFDDKDNQLYHLLIKRYNSFPPYYRFEHYQSNKNKKIDIIRTVQNETSKMRICCQHIENNFYELIIEIQNNKQKNDIIGWAMHLHDFSKKHLLNIKWYSFQDGYNKEYVKPY